MMVDNPSRMKSIGVCVCVRGEGGYIKDLILVSSCCIILFFTKALTFSNRLVNTLQRNETEHVGSLQ